MKILIVEDDPKILEFVSKGLKEEGYTVDRASDGEDGLYLATTNKYDIILLDWVLPKKSGLSICKILRIKEFTIPIIMLTSKNEIEDKIEGLECGADDYITKPFLFKELVARIHSLVRRAHFHAKDKMVIDNLEVDVYKRVVRRDNEIIELTSKEFDILVYMLSNQGSTITHTNLQEKIWGIDEVTSSNVITVFIHHLRKKIDFEGQKTLIKTMRGSGYRIDKQS